MSRRHLKWYSFHMQLNREFIIKWFKYCLKFKVNFQLHCLNFLRNHLFITSVFLFGSLWAHIRLVVYTSAHVQMPEDDDSSMTLTLLLLRSCLFLKSGLILFLAKLKVMECWWFSCLQLSLTGVAGMCHMLSLLNVFEIFNLNLNICVESFLNC